MPLQNKAEGHRQRLRQKFINSGLTGFHDYEIVELLLSLGTPRRDCKPQAKEAVRRFKSLRGVLEASPEELQEIDGVGPVNAYVIKLVQEVARQFLRDKIIAQPAFSSSREIFDYLYHSMRDLRKEVFKVIYLSSQNQIIHIADLFEGTVAGAVVSPREVIEGAIRHHAVSVIFVHNHPSGNPEPSLSDKEITRELTCACTVMQFKVLDHIIIGDNRYFSFAGEGLIDDYTLDYMNLRAKAASETRRKLYKAKTDSAKPPWAEPPLK